MQKSVHIDTSARDEMRLRQRLGWGQSPALRTAMGAFGEGFWSFLWKRIWIC